jgi:hypothetical protein
MKKNVMLKIASVLMVAVLLTTCAISSTFAKYTATASDSATARVAKWGVTADMTIDGLFAKTYTGADGKAVTAATVDGEQDNIMAPGTYDEYTLTTQISGTPEVSVAVDYTPTLTLTGFDTYCPLVFYVDGNKVTNVDGTDCDTAAELKAAVEKAINAFDIPNVAPNTDLNTLKDMKIEWEWLFEVDDDANALNGIANDANDKALGDAAALGNAATVTLNIAVNIYQTGAAAERPAPVVGG